MPVLLGVWLKIVPNRDTLPEMPAMTFDDLLALARTAAQNAYCPYSRFQVGAALLTDDGKLFTGCNVENASYGLAICAERVAIFSAVASGHRKIRKIAVSCVSAPVDAPRTSRTPCGACRQVIREFADEETRIAVDGVGVFTMEELLPVGFVLPR
jgi:cytidine deaminase